MKRCEPPLVEAISDDGRHGDIHRIRKTNHGARRLPTDTTDPDCRETAEAFGIAHARVFDPETSRSAIGKALDSRTQMPVETPVAESPPPWDLAHEGIPVPVPPPEGADRVHPDD